MIIGELVPKNFALALPRQVSKIVIPFQLAFTAVFRPFVRLLNSTANVILRADRHRAEGGDSARPAPPTS